MPLVTPGYQLADGEVATNEKLNQGFTPQVTLTDADKAELAAEIGATVNLFSNPDLSQWTRGVGPVTCDAEERTFLADHWFVRPLINTGYGGSPSATVAASYQREADAVHETLIYRARFGYSAGPTDEFGDIEFGQKREARVMAALADGGVVTFEIENQLGNTLTPKCRLYSCDTPEDYTTVTAEETVTGTATGGGTTVANGERKVFTFNFDPESYASALKNGGEICLVIPEGVSGAGYVRVYAIAQLETGTVATARVLERDATGEQNTGDSADAGTVEPEYLVNGEFSPARFAALGGNVSCAVGETLVCDGWTLVNTAGTVTSSRDLAEVPNDESGASLKLTGHATATAAIVLRAKVYRAQAVTAQRSLVCQIYVRNGTGASITPTLLVKTCGTANDFGDLTVEVTQALTPIANGDWVRLTHTFDASSMTDVANGFCVDLQLAANTLDNAAKNVRFAQASLKPGLSVPAWVPVPNDAGALVFGGAHNLKLEYLTGIGFTVEAEAAVLVARDGSARKFGATGLLGVAMNTNGLLGLDTGAIAAATEYDVYLLANDAGYSAIAVIAGNEPIGTEGYPWRWKCSTLKTVAGVAQFPFFFQRGRSVYRSGSGTAVYTPADANWHTVSIATMVPAAAIKVAGYVSVITADDCRIALAGNASSAAGQGAGIQSLLLQDTGVAWNAPGAFINGRAGAAFEVGVQTAGQIWAAADITGTPDFTLEISRYDLP
jgi:hypothetical protein